MLGIRFDTGSGDQSDLPLKLAYLNSALQTGTRSPLDGAIVEFVRQKCSAAVGSNGEDENDVNLEDWDKLAEVPFDSNRRLLSILVSHSRVGTDQKGLLITKARLKSA